MPQPMRLLVAGCWQHKSGVLGSGTWNFAASSRLDRVEITGSEGWITCSIFEEEPLQIDSGGAVWEEFVENPAIIQLNHVAAMRNALISGSPHPSTGKSASHTAWIMDRIRPLDFVVP
ncbi:hypothetical protein [Altererythrobacter sp. BO-6]|uniref:hypothetical protein n=1 Tax=Altererythrobacter sp. BO-6 TaxID=2604537 RepID=UPI001F49DF6F|nr:hypothetical protein [Altererythrobacter sp. BO-6]